MKTKKWRDVKNALVMVVVMAAMMSTATYAWFQLTNDAAVTGMQMTAGGSSGIQVSLDNSNWSTTVDLTANLPEGTDPNQMIHQVTVKNGEGPVFYKPFYAGGKVTDVNVIDGGLSTYVARYDYYIRSVDGSVNVGLKTATGTAGTDGSYVRKADADDQNSAEAAVRVGIVLSDAPNVMHIFEPNFEENENTGSKAESEYALKPTSTVVADRTGVISTGKGTTDYISTTLFQATTEGKAVTMYVWLEGTDDDCVDQIQADKLVGQLTFTTVN